MRKLRIAVLFGVFSIIGYSSVLAQDTTGDKPVAPPDNIVGKLAAERYRIGFQDILEVQVFKHPELSQRVPVSPGGTIVLFRLNKPVVAVCKTERELATEIAAAYKANFVRDPQVNVVVAEQKSQSISVLGAVEKPGTYFVNRRVHLLEMLALAGGPNKESGTRMVIARTGSTSDCKQNLENVDGDKIAIFDFKIRDIQQGRETLWMQPGDVVSIFPADVIYVYGNVNKQGSYKATEAITLTQAIVTAEGLTSTARKENVRILRQQPGSAERLEFTFDLNQIDKGKVKDPYLEPNDIIAVSQDKTKAILFGVTNMIKSTVPNVVYRGL